MTHTDAAVTHNISLIRYAYECLGAGDLDACVDLLDENFIANVPGRREPLHGRDPWRRAAESIATAFPDLRYDIEDIFGAGDRVTVRLRLVGTHTGPFGDSPATHRPVEFTSIGIYRVSGNRIAEEWISPDRLWLVQQVSAGPDRP
ncbi:ester cyclase [Nocardia carnea]|uniref:ester cyclase n=1 Tax=Nocardia carnea TaxID=37328 RepID=UPI00245750CA|nr:ester cyclase [Nocardia carnea]